MACVIFTMDGRREGGRDGGGRRDGGGDRDGGGGDRGGGRGRDRGGGGGRTTAIISNEIRATIIHHVLVHGMSMRKAGPNISRFNQI